VVHSLQIRYTSTLYIIKFPTLNKKKVFEIVKIDQRTVEDNFNNII